MAQVEEIEDRWLRAIGIPAFALTIPRAFDLFGELSWKNGSHWLGQLWFLALAAAIWQGNRYLLFKQRQHLDWFRHPVRKIAALVFAIVFYTVPITIAALWLWYRFAPTASHPHVDWNAIRQVALANTICVVFVTHVYETVFLIKERRGDRLDVERLERARVEAELEGLRNQVDPHFLFNSLNTLSALIESDPPRALRFNESLGRVYRYLLHTRGRDLVPLHDELEFVADYTALLRLRFGASIQLQMLGSATSRRWLPPSALQMLVENAVKHNAFSERDPLHIRIEIDDMFACVTNARRARTLGQRSNLGLGLGLLNLDQRCRLLAGRGIRIHEQQDSFAVELPLLGD